MTDFADAARAATLAMRDLFPPTPLQKNIHLSERSARKSG
jgi:threonine dehydratase